MNINRKIIKMIKTFTKSESKSYLNHLKTRRLGALSFLFGTFSALLIIIDKYSGSFESTISGFLPLFHDFIGMFVIGFYLLIIVGIYRSSSKECIEKILKTSFLISALLIMSFDSELIAPIMTGSNLLIFCGCYILNRQQGFTRSWGRSQRVITQLRLLKWELDETINMAASLSPIRKTQQELIEVKIRTKYIDILKKHAFERQVDIIGDYLSTNDAAFSWIKSLKK